MAVKTLMAYKQYSLSGENLIIGKSERPYLIIGWLKAAREEQMY